MVNKTARSPPCSWGAGAQEQLERLAEEQQSVADELEELSRDERAQEEALGDLSQLAGKPRPWPRRWRGVALLLRPSSARNASSPPSGRREEPREGGRGRLRRARVQDPWRLRARRGGAPRSDRLGALRYAIPGAGELQRLPPAVRQLVLQYFERLNRGGGGGGGL